MGLSMENLNSCASDLPAKKLFVKWTQVAGLVLTVGWLIASPVKSYADETNGLGLCPQSREKTPKAPEEYIQRINPLEKNEKNLKKGRLLYMVKAKTLQCKK
jgi:hypothetical protein